jgi:hypothetical protein
VATFPTAVASEAAQVMSAQLRALMEAQRADFVPSRTAIVVANEALLLPVLARFAPALPARERLLNDRERKNAVLLFRRRCLLAQQLLDLNPRQACELVQLFLCLIRMECIPADMQLL